MPSFAAIDVGSNAVRFAVGEVKKGGRLSLAESVREPIRIGQDVFDRGEIDETTVVRLEEAFRNFFAISKKHEVEILHAVATSAFREATNKDAVIKRIKSNTGIEIEVIPGEEEARLIYMAVADKIDLNEKLSLLIDIGGGSVEVTIVEKGEVIASDSARMGTVRLLQLLRDTKNPGKTLERLIREYAKGVKQQISGSIQKRKFDLAAGTGGNIETLGELAVKFCGAKSEKKLSVKHLGELVERLQALSYEERIKKLDLKPDRADVIFPAAIVLQQILNVSRIDELEIPNVGVKDGVLLDIVGANLEEKTERRRAHVIGFAKELGNKYQYSQAHASQVAKLSLVLFDQLIDLHKLSDKYRLLLEIAALLHDIGQFVNYESHHKHSYYLIKACPFVGLKPREQLIVASVARYHRKSAPKLEHEAYSSLDSSEREPMVKLAAILRLADALDREHSQNVEAVSASWNGNKKVHLSVKGKGELLLEKWAVNKKSKLFEDVFNTELTLED